MPSFPHTLMRFLTALLKHQARRWLGEEALGIAAEMLIDEQVQARLDAWLTQAEAQQRLLRAAETAQAWLQDPAHCPDADLRALFRDLPFGGLPFVQAALAELPQAPDTAHLAGADGRDGSEWSGVAWRYHEANLQMRARAGRVWIVTVDSSYPLHLRCSAPSGVVGPDGRWACRTEPMGEQYFVHTINLDA